MIPNDTPQHPLWFIALLPPADLSQEITAIKQDFSDRYRSRAALKSPPHITLYPPFTWPETTIAQVRSTLASFAQTRSAFPIQLQGYGAFAPRVIYIHVEPTLALTQVHQDLLNVLDRSLQLRNARETQRPYRPHLTIAFRDLSRSSFEQAWPAYRDRPFQAEFLATHLTLLYHTRQRWMVDRTFPFQPTVLFETSNHGDGGRLLH